MSINRSQLGRGPAIVTYGSGGGAITMFSRDDMVPRHAPVWKPVLTSMYGEVDKLKSDLVIRFALRLWGAWENISTLFPAYILTPNAGASIFGTTDTPLTVLAKNGDQIVYANAQITELANLYLGVDAELFAADVVFTALIKNNANPEDANAFYTVTTGNAYADTAFAKTNFKRVRFVGTWGAVAGFGTIVPQKGFNLSWAFRSIPVPCDGLGTADMTVGELLGTARAIPIGPTLTQIETAANSQGRPHGALLSGGSAADLSLAGSGITVVCKNAGMTEHGYAFGQEPLRVGEMMWVTTRGFTAGAPQAVATAA